MDDHPRRGDVFFAFLDPVLGCEQGGTRPVLVVQNDAGNRRSKTIIVAAITGKPKANLPVHVPVPASAGLREGSVALLEQLRTIDKLDKIGADKVRELLTDTCGVTAEQADEILRFIACPGTSADKLAFLEQYRGRNETFDTGLDELRTVVGYLPAFGVPEENFELDLTIARGLDYYTGTVYETVLLDHPEVGSICSGGRYDDLAGYYTNKSLPGVGISIGLTRLFYILQEQNMISDAVLTAPADVLILPMTDDLSAAVSLASMLRAGGLRVQLYSEKKKFKAKIGYADKLGIPFVIFLGEDEIAQNVCALKNMVTGVQEAVTQAAALETIRAEIARRTAGALLRES